MKNLGRRSRRKKAHRLPWLVGGFLVVLLIAAAAVFFLKPFDGRGYQASPAVSADKKASHSTSKKSSAQTNSGSAAPSTSWLATNGKPNELPILMFHYVDEPQNNPQPAWNSNYMTPENLETICQWLNDNNYTTLTADEAVKVLTTSTKPSNKMVWLTFDDGHENDYTYAYPILAKHHIHATFNMITGTLPTYQGTDTTYITEAQMLEMQKSGWISFESHTVSHPDLSALSAADQSSQLKESRDTLNSILHQSTNVIVYPSGKSTGETQQLAAATGYKIGLIEGQEIAVGGADLLNIPRLRMSSTSGTAALTDYLTPAETYNTANTPQSATANSSAN